MMMILTTTATINKGAELFDDRNLSPVMCGMVLKGSPLLLVAQEDSKDV